MLRRVASIWQNLPEWRVAGLLAVCCIAVYLPGMVLMPTIDRDEARFAQASRQIFESLALPEGERVDALHGGGLIVPMVGGTERINKPPLIYWLQSTAAAMLTLGDPLQDAIWMYRVPSLLAAIVTVIALYRIGLRRFGSRIALLAALMLAASPLFAWEARQARADMVLVALTTIALGALWSCFDGRGAKWWTPLLLWGAVAGGVLTKGPLTPLILILTALLASMASGRWQWLLKTKPVMGAAIVVLAVAPWLYLVGSHVGHELYWTRVLDETLGRSVSPAEGHWGPPGYHLVLAAVLFWPGAMLAGKAMFGAARRLALGTMGKHRPGRSAAFLSAWLVPTWLVMELISTKLPHYVLPLYPALAILSAVAIVRAERTRGQTDQTTRSGVGLWKVLGAGLFIALPVAGAFALGPAWWPSVLVLGSLYLHVARHRAAAGWLSLQRSALAAGLLFATVVPIALAFSPNVHITPQIERCLTEMQPDAVGSLDYHEDSLVFASRGMLKRLGSVEEAIAFSEAYPRGILIIPEGSQDALPAGLNARELGAAAGFNYSKGRHTALVILGLGQLESQP